VLRVSKHAKKPYRTQLIKHTTDGTLCHKGRYRDASHIDSDRYTITSNVDLALSRSAQSDSRVPRLLGPTGSHKFGGPHSGKHFFFRVFSASLSIATEGHR